MQDLSQFFESSDVKPERYSCTSATKTRQGATFRARPSLCERITSGSHVLQDDSITNLRRALDDGACAQLERSPRTPYDGGYPPWAQIVIYPNHHAVAVEEHDVDSKPHEHHVHAHERLEPPGLEQHPGILVEPIAPEQSPAFAGHPARPFEIPAEHGPSRRVDRAQNRDALCSRTVHGSPLCRQIPGPVRTRAAVTAPPAVLQSTRNGARSSAAVELDPRRHYLTPGDVPRAIPLPHRTSTPPPRWIRSGCLPLWYVTRLPRRVLYGAALQIGRSRAIRPYRCWARRYCFTRSISRSVS